MYSQEEIEKKRQEALQKQQKRQSAGPSSSQNTYVTNLSNQQQQKAQNYSANSTFKQSSNYSSPGPYPKNYQNYKNNNVMKQQNPSPRYNPMSASSFFNKDKTVNVDYQMIANSRFSAETSDYCTEANDIFKTLPTALYDPKSKIWHFHLNDYNALCEKLIAIRNKVTINKLPEVVLKTFRNLIKEEGKPNTPVDLSGLDKKLVDSLYPFQKEGIEYGVRKNGKCLIADDMGLGKTRQALGIAQYYKNNWPLLIVTPSSVRYQWSQAIFDFLDSVPVQHIHQITNSKHPIENAKIIIVSYDLLHRRIDEIEARKFGVLIFDESHYLKSAKTERYKAAKRLIKYARNVILLTGTPALSRPIELHSQIQLIVPNFMGWQAYGERYCAGVNGRFGWNFNGSSNLKELELFLKSSCLIRRLKSDVMTQLPSKIRQKILLDPQTIQIGTKEMKDALKNTQKKLNSTMHHSAILEYYAQSSKAKQKAVCNYISDLLETEQKFLVFAHHNDMIQSICELLQKKKISFMVIDGKTNPLLRQQNVDRFQNEENMLVAVLSITAASTGLNMTAASLVVFAELYWTPGVLCQAEDRVHRIGQSDAVVIQYLIAKGTVDDYFWPTIQAKINVLNEVGLDQNFDLQSASYAEQAPLVDQQTLDDFLQSPDFDDFDLPSNKNENSKNSSNVSNSKEDSKNFACDKEMEKFSEIDDDVFNEIDLDNFV